MAATASRAMSIPNRWPTVRVSPREMLPLTLATERAPNIAGSTRARTHAAAAAAAAT